MANETSPPNGKAIARNAQKEVQAMMSAMAAKVTGKVKQKALPNDEIFARTFPRLWEWLSATQIGESMEKDPARVVLSIEDSTWKATLSDNALRCSLTGVGLTFDEALKSLEGLFGQQDAPWVTWKQRGKALRELHPEPEKNA